MPNRITPIAALIAAILCSAPLDAKDAFVMPKAADAKTYPAHDTNGQEKVTVAADPYDRASKTQPVFRIKYKEEDLLPVMLVITNDAGQPVALTDMQVELVTARRVRLSPATEDDIYRRIAHQPLKGDQPSASPLPFPRRKVHASVKKEEAEEVQDSRFAAKAVEAHTTRAGFLFFDVEDVDNPLAGAHLYVSGVRNGKGEELIFFDIPLDNYLQQSPGR